MVDDKVDNPKIKETVEHNLQKSLFDKPLTYCNGRRNKIKIIW